jgi:hypothetical protein
MMGNANVDVAKYLEPISAVPESAYFIRRLFSVRDLIGKAHLLSGAQQFDQLYGLTPADVATIANVLLGASHKLEEGRRINGTVTFVPMPDRNRLPIIRFRKALRLETDTIVMLMMASRNLALALEKNRSGLLLITGFLDSRTDDRLLSFNIADRRGVSITERGAVIAAITPDSILTTRAATGQSGTLDNRNQVLRFALTEPEAPHHVTLDPPAMYQFDWRRRCIDRMIRRAWDHGHGGAIVMVPAGSSSLRAMESRFVLSRGMSRRALRRQFDIAMKVHAQMHGASIREQGAEEHRVFQLFRKEEEKLRRSVDWIGGLSRVDGVVVIDSELALQAFGAKIQTLQPSQEVLIKDCIGARDEYLGLVSELGGTRHQSAASFVATIDGAVCFVASQDGRGTLLTKRKGERLIAFANFQYLFEMPAFPDLFQSSIGYARLDSR